jgi:hypothetical protein
MNIPLLSFSTKKFIETAVAIGLAVLIWVVFCVWITGCSTTNSKTCNPPKITIVGVKLDIRPLKDFYGKTLGFQIWSVGVVLKDNSNFPVVLVDAVVSVDGKKYRPNCISFSGVFPDSLHAVNIFVSYPPLIQATADRSHTISGMVFYGEDRKFLNFERKFVLPESSETAKL